MSKLSSWLPQNLLDSQKVHCLHFLDLSEMIVSRLPTAQKGDCHHGVSLLKLANWRKEEAGSYHQTPLCLLLPCFHCVWSYFLLLALWWVSGGSTSDHCTRRAFVWWTILHGSVLHWHQLQIGWGHIGVNQCWRLSKTQHFPAPLVNELIGCALGICLRFHCNGGCGWIR